ncbi:MAG: hypothetical protein LAQ69_30635 [Acidobacteriia bacterium]|nr:hypothetical protein [Terriglobia bacterium]
MANFFMGWDWAAGGLLGLALASWGKSLLVAFLAQSLSTVPLIRWIFAFWGSTWGWRCSAASRSEWLRPCSLGKLRFVGCPKLGVS